MNERKRLVAVGILFACVVAGAGRSTHAGLYVPMGDVLCHAVVAGPHYFHSAIERVGFNASAFAAGWWPRNDEARQRLEERTLRYLAAGFARYVAENYPVEYLLSPRCELTESGTGVLETERAAYAARDGLLTTYDEDQKTAVDWIPNFGVAFRHYATTLSDRVALVMGNAEYEHLGSLRSPLNDAESVAAALKRLGFDTSLLLDGDVIAMRNALAAFAQRTANADIALVYFAGHGVEVDGVNYLVPVSFRLERAADWHAEAVALDSVLTATTSAAVPIVILDAARTNFLVADNPLRAEAPAQGAGRTVAGTSVDTSARGALVAFAVVRGQQAAESLEHGVYTAALLAHLEEPGLELERMFRRVGATVAASAWQRPVVYSTLIESRPIRLAGADPLPAPGGPATGR